MRVARVTVIMAEAMTVSMAVRMTGVIVAVRMIAHLPHSTHSPGDAQP
jgi:hypothetical protein